MGLNTYKGGTLMGKKEYIVVPKRLVTMKKVGKEGNYEGSDLWLHQDIINEPPTKIAKGLYLDLEKSNMNTSKLVKRAVEVHGKNGKVFTRMQWVDPRTGEPVTEDRHKDDPENHKRSKHTPDEQRRALSGFYTENKEHATKFAHHTGMDNAHKTNLGDFIDHAMKHYNSIPSDHLDRHFPTQEQMKDEKDNSQKISERMEKEQAKKEKQDDFDVLQVYKGTSITESGAFEMNHGKPDYTADNDDYYSSPHGRFENLLGGATKEGLEYLFSIPEHGIKATLDEATMLDYGVAEFSMHLASHEGDYVGSVIRQVEKYGNGTYSVTNYEMTLQPEYHNKGISDTYYKRSEQLWKKNAGGNPVQIDLMANISVGVYAWAKKGFDFNGEYERTAAIQELSEFCQHSLNTPMEKVLESCNVTLDDLQHSWDFANLHDGNEYKFADLLKNSTVKSDRDKEEIIGSGHLGKAFMLCGKTSWNGVKRI